MLKKLLIANNTFCSTNELKAGEEENNTSQNIPFPFSCYFNMLLAYNNADTVNIFTLLTKPLT